MHLCVIINRFYPAIGGMENLFKDITYFCSDFFKTTVITSNIISFSNVFIKYRVIKKKNELLKKNLKIIRVKTLCNPIIKNIFYINQFLNKNFELYFDRTLKYLKFNDNLTYISGEDYIQNFVKMFLFQRKFTNPNFIQIYYYLKELLKIDKFNIIHSTPIHKTSNYFAFKFSRKYNIPFICTPLFHINPYNKTIFYPSYQYILRNSEAIVALTQKEKNFYEFYGIDKNKIFIIPPGIDPNNYNKPDITFFKKKYNIDNNTSILFFLGRRSYDKGIFHCIYALKYLMSKFRNIILIIAGPTTKSYDYFYNKLSKNIKKHILDLGFVNEQEKINALASCDIFLLPSLEDSFGIVYLEAWLFKKPVIGALNGNVEGLIDNNKNGILIPFNDIKCLETKIEELLKNEEERKKLGNNGFNKLINCFTLKKTNDKIMSLYQSF